MSDKTSIFKVQIDMSNIDQHRYEQLSFTVALSKHESMSHLVLRLLAYAMVPEQNVLFGHGGSSGTEPDVMVKDYDDHYIYWIDAGFPSLMRVKKANRKADQVLLFSLSHSQWLSESYNDLMNMGNTQLVLFNPSVINHVAQGVSRNINWSLVIDGNKMGLSDQHNYYESIINTEHSRQSPELVMI